jgi:hypothetical protein
MPVNQTMPLRLDWAIRSGGKNSSTSMSCAAAKEKNRPQYACVSDHSECVDASPGYFCNCTKGYEGNPYIVNGCTSKQQCSI